MGKRKRPSPRRKAWGGKNSRKSAYPKHPPIGSAIRTANKIATGGKRRKNYNTSTDDEFNELNSNLEMG